MDLILSSFGIGPNRTDSFSPLFFDRMPPALFCNRKQQFVPDFGALLVAENIILDTATSEALGKGKSQLFKGYSEVLRVLTGEGLVRTEDYSAILHDRKSDLESAIASDLEHGLDLLPVLRQSTEKWHKALSLMRDDPFREILNEELRENQHEFSMHMHITGNSLSHAQLAYEYRKMMLDSETESADKLSDKELEILAPYITYTNANLILSESLGGGVFDWPDIVPFYNHKARTSLTTEPSEGFRASSALRKIFELTFPELGEMDTHEVLKILKDKRIRRLREMVSSVLENDEDIDPEFVVRVLREVIGDERRAKKLSKIVSYATLPLGLIPMAGTPLQKAAEEAADFAFSKVKEPKHSWYFMVNEVLAKRHPGG